MDKKQPEAIRIAEWLEGIRGNTWPSYIPQEAAAELRRQHAEIETLRAGYDAARLEIASLRAQESAIGAGGVEPLRKRCLHQISEPDILRGAAKLIAAARQALEALDWLPTSKHSQALWHRQQPALAAIREALEAAPQPAAQALDAPKEYLSADDFGDLDRFYEMASDGEGHDISKKRMQRLAELGVIQHKGRGRYSTTAFGLLVIDKWKRLPLETHAETNSRCGAEFKARIDRMNNEARAVQAKQGGA